MKINKEELLKYNDIITADELLELATQYEIKNISKQIDPRYKIVIDENGNFSEIESEEK